jgi:hypothetical protein
MSLDRDLERQLMRSSSTNSIGVPSSVHATPIDTRLE